MKQFRMNMNAALGGGKTDNVLYFPFTLFKEKSGAGRTFVYMSKLNKAKSPIQGVP